MLLLTIDAASDTPRYQQLIRQIRSRIDDGSLRPGERLPSTRALAAQLGLHRSTVATAYHELWALGVLDLRAGACPRVRRRLQIAAEARRHSSGILDWRTVASPAGNRIREIDADFHPESLRRDPSRIDFSRIDVDARLFPVESFRASLRHVMSEEGAALLRYGDRSGFLPLREAIARRLRIHGISATSDEILITNGSQHAIDLVLRMIAAPGRAVAIESPTYAYLLPLIRFHGLRAIEIPHGADGMDLGRLDTALRRRRPSLVYTIPNFHNPTGVTTAQAHREELLRLCEAHRVPILEDGFDEEMKYFGRAVLPVKASDKHHVVIYCGTFSKVLFPGLRIGWVVAERGCIERLAAIRRFSELSPNMLLQAAMTDFCENGAYDRHISRMHRAFRRRMQAALRALRLHFRPEDCEWNDPAGGFLIWLELRGRRSGGEWKSLFAAHGVDVASGDDFFFSSTRGPYVRLSIASLEEEEIVEGVRRMAAAIRESRHSGRAVS